MVWFGFDIVPKVISAFLLAVFPRFPERIELACELATAVLAAETLDIFYKDGRRVHEEGAPSLGGGADPMAFSHQAHRALISDFLDAIGEDRDPAVSGREALKVHLPIGALLRSAQSGRRCVREGDREWASTRN